MRSALTLRSVAAATVVVAVAIAACSRATGSSPTPPPSTFASQPSPHASPSLTAGPITGPTDPPAIELCPSDGVPATGPEVTITDPGVTMHAPVGWMPSTVEAYRAQMLKFLGNFDDPAVTEMADWAVGLIDSNVMRAAVAGQSKPSGAGTFLVVSVLPATGDLQAIVDARVADEVAHAPPTKVVDFGPTDLPIGPAYCVGVLSDNDVGIPSQTIEYIAVLDDGRALSVGTSAPRGDAPFADLVRSIALTLTAD